MFTELTQELLELTVVEKGHCNALYASVRPGTGCCSACCTCCQCIFFC
jgi:hypothetical protein